MPANTSLIANAAIQEKKEKVYRRILAFALRRGAAGFSADELAVAWGCSHNHVAPRCTELLQAGELVASGRTRPTRTGSPARVLTLPSKQNRLFEEVHSADIVPGVQLPDDLSGDERQRQRRIDAGDLR